MEMNNRPNVEATKATSTNKKNNKDKKPSKKMLRLVIILIVLIVIIVAVCCEAVKEKKNNSAQQTVPSTSSVVSTTVRNTTIEPSTYLDDDGEDATPHFSKDGKKMMEGNHLATFEGVAKSTINGKKGLYYFSNATYDPSYTGLATGPNNRLYYVKNGKADLHYTGLISKDNYLRIFENGRYRSDFSGKIHMPDGDYDVHHGAVYGYCLGQPDNFEWKPWFWFLDGEPDMYHTNG